MHRKRDEKSVSDKQMSIQDKYAILKKLREEGVLTQLMKSITTTKITPDRKVVAGLGVKKTAGRDIVHKELLDKNKKYIICKINKGASFVDFVSPKEDEYLKVCISFLDQRYKSNPVLASTDPAFDFTVSFEIPSHLDPASLVSAASPIVIVLQKQRGEERAVVLSTERVDWRDLISSNSVEITKEMQPIDLKHKGSLGLLYIDLDLHPYLSKDKLLSSSHVRKQQELEKKFEAESYQQFLEYSKEWYAEFKEIRASHSKRLVKIFAETDDRSSIYTPTSSLIYPLVAHKMIDSPLHAARFVSLLPFQRLEDFNSDRVEIWHSLQAFLSRGCGDAEDHSVLLCNLLLGFGLEAYVCIGTNMEGAHAWVTTFDYSDGSGRATVCIWESLTGQKFKLGDPRIKRFYRSIGCVFNDKAFYANIQPSDLVENTIFDLEDSSLWKAMDSAMVKALPKVPMANLMPTDLDVIKEEEKLEKALKARVSSIRLDEVGLRTKYDKQLEYMLSSALYNYELERLASMTFASNEFKSSIKNYVPEGHTFKAFPIQFNHFDINKMVVALLKNRVAFDVLTVRGDQVHHAVRAKIVTYPDNVCAVWIMLACRYKAVAEN